MIKHHYYCFWRTPLEPLNCGYEKGWDGSEWQHKNYGPAVPLSMLWGSDMASDFLQWETQMWLILWVEFWGFPNTHNCFDYGSGTLWKQGCLSDLSLGTHILCHLREEMSCSRLYSMLAGVFASLYRPVEMPVETVVISTGVLTQHLASSGAMWQKVWSPLHTARAGRTWDGLYSCSSYWLAA